MVEVIILNKAQEDLEEIGAYLARFSEKSAGLHLERIFKAIESLKTFPLLGKIFLELDYPKVREIKAGPYRIFYHIVSETKIHILTIHHSATPFDWDELKPN